MSALHLYLAAHFIAACWLLGVALSCFDQKHPRDWLRENQGTDAAGHWLVGVVLTLAICCAIPWPVLAYLYTDSRR